MRALLLAVIFLFSSAAIAGTPFDPDGCVDTVDQLKKAARDASDAAERAAVSMNNSQVSSALSDVESHLSRAQIECGAPDYCTSLKMSARQLGVDAVYSICQAYETGARLAVCKACLGK